MGIEVFYGIGALILLVAIAYGVMRGRRPRSTQRAADVWCSRPQKLG